MRPLRVTGAPGSIIKLRRVALRFGAGTSFRCPPPWVVGSSSRSSFLPALFRLCGSLLGAILSASPSQSLSQSITLSWGSIRRTKVSPGPNGGSGSGKISASVTLVSQRFRHNKFSVTKRAKSLVKNSHERHCSTNIAKSLTFSSSLPISKRFPI